MQVNTQSLGGRSSTHLEQSLEELELVGSEGEEEEEEGEKEDMEGRVEGLEARLVLVMEILAERLDVDCLGVGRTDWEEWVLEDNVREFKEGLDLVERTKEASLEE